MKYTQLSNEELTEVYEQCLRDLESVASRFSVKRFLSVAIYMPTTLEFAGATFKSDHKFGGCSVRRNNGKCKIIIAVNKLICKAELIDILKNTIYHELLHAFTTLDQIKDEIEIICRLEAADYSREEIIKQLKELKDRYDRNDGHDEPWSLYADFVNKKLNLSMPIKANPTEEEMRLMTPVFDEEQPRYNIRCTNPNCKYHKGLIRVYEDDLLDVDEKIVKYLIGVKLSNGLVCTECGSPVDIDYADDMAEKVLDRLAELTDI